MPLFVVLETFWLHSQHKTNAFHEILIYRRNASVNPPSTEITAPVVLEIWSLVSQTMAFVQCCGVPVLAKWISKGKAWERACTTESRSTERITFQGAKRTFRSPCKSRYFVWTG